MPPRSLRRFFFGIVLIGVVLYGATLVAAFTPLTERTLRAEVTVDAPVGVVWQVLTKLDNYAEWNPFFQQASGTVGVGETLRLEAHSDSGMMVFTPTVLEACEDRELRWLGRVLLPGVFDGEHSFTLMPLEGGRVQVVQSEVFRGVLVPFFGALLNETERSFDALNQALKTRAEQDANR